MAYALLFEEEENSPHICNKNDVNKSLQEACHLIYDININGFPIIYLKNTSKSFKTNLKSPLKKKENILCYTENQK